MPRKNSGNHSFIDNIVIHTYKKANKYVYGKVSNFTVNRDHSYKNKETRVVPIYLQIFSCQDVAIKAARLFYQCSLTEKGR